MANLKGITVQLGADTTKLTTALKGVNQDIRETQSQLKEVEKLLKLDPENVELLRQKQEYLAEAIAQTSEKLQTLRLASEQAAATAGNYDAWKAQYDPIQEQITETRDKLSELKQSAAEAQEQFDNGQITAEQYDAVKAQVDETKQHLEELKAAAQAVSDEFGNPISPEAFDALQREIVSTEQSLRGFQEQLDGLDGGRVSQELGLASQAASMFGDVLLANLASGGIEAAVRSIIDATRELVSAYIEFGDQVDKSSQKANMSREAYQEWASVMEHYGSSINVVETMITRLINKADEGNDAFRRLGITQEELASLSPEQMWERVIYALQDMEDEADRAAIAYDLFGRQSKELNPLLNATSEEVEQLRQLLHDVGGVMGDEDVDAARDLTDDLQTLRESWDGLMRNTIGPCIPMLNSVVEGLTSVTARCNELGITLLDVLAPNFASLIRSGQQISDSFHSTESEADSTAGAVSKLADSFRDAASAAEDAASGTGRFEAAQRTASSHIAEVTSQLERQYQALKSSLASQYSEAKSYYDRMYTAAKRSFDAQYTAAKRAYDQQYSAAKKAYDQQYSAMKDSLDASYEAQKKAYEKIYEELKNSLDKEYSAQKDSCDKEYDALQSRLDKEYDALSSAWDDRLDKLKDAQSKELDAIRESQEAELEAYQSAADAKIDLINEEYTERLKLVDEEKYNAVKAIDEQIAALKAQNEAERKAEERSEQEQRKNELKKAVTTAKTAEDRAEAIEKYNSYIARLERKNREDQRKEAIDALNDRKNEIKDQAEAAKTELRQLQSDTLSEQKQLNADGLKELKKVQAAELQSVKDLQAEEYKAAKSARQEELAARKEANQQELSAFKEANTAKLDALKEDHTAQLDLLKEQQESYLAQLKSGHEAQLESMKESQDAQLESMKLAQEDQLTVLKNSQEDALAAMKESSTARLEEMKQEHEAELEQMQEQNQEKIAELEKTYEKMITDAQEATAKGKEVADSAGEVLEGFRIALRNAGVDVDDLKEKLSKYGITSEEFDRAVESSGGKADVFAQKLLEAANHGTTYDQIMDAMGLTMEDLTKIFGTTGTGFSHMSGSMNNDAKKTSTSFSNLGKDIATGMRTMGTNISAGLQNAASNLRGLGTNAWTWGRDLIQGFINGVSANYRALIQTVQNVAASVSSYLHFSRPDVGPLRDYEQWMPDFMRGMADSLDRSRSALKDAAARAAQDIQKELQSGSNVDLRVNAGGAASAYRDMLSRVSIPDSTLKVESRMNRAVDVTGTSAMLETSEIMKEQNAMLNTMVKIMSQFLPYIPRIAEMQMVTDTGALVGQLSSRMNQALGEIAAREGRL